jgi:hypothetical protein
MISDKGSLGLIPLKMPPPGVFIDIAIDLDFIVNCVQSTHYLKHHKKNIRPHNAERTDVLTIISFSEKG